MTQPLPYLFSTLFLIASVAGPKAFAQTSTNTGAPSSQGPGPTSNSPGGQPHTDPNSVTRPGNSAGMSGANTPSGDNQNTAAQTTPSRDTVGSTSTANETNQTVGPKDTMQTSASVATENPMTDDRSPSTAVMIGVLVILVAGAAAFIMRRKQRPGAM